MLLYFLTVGIGYGIAYLITGTGLAPWRSIVGFFVAFIFSWIGGSVLIALILHAGNLEINSFDKVIGRAFAWALVASGYGVYRGRKKLKTNYASGKTTPGKPTSTAPSNNEAYATALAEIEECRLDKGIWARSFADSGGDEPKAKAAYIKARAEAIQSADVWVNTMPPGAEDAASVKATDKPAPVATPLSEELVWAGVGILLVFVVLLVVKLVNQDEKRQEVAASPVQTPVDWSKGTITPPVQAPAPSVDPQTIFAEGLTAYKNKDYAGALAKWRPLADHGMADAQGYLGLMYARGEGVSKNDAEAISWYRKAAEQGDASAQFNLGTMYVAGRGIQKNDAEALAWFRKAAEQGDSYAQFNLGWMYANGKGEQQNDVEAVDWWRKAAEQGLVEAQFSLGWMYANGQGVQQNDAEAVSWYRKAAAQGYANAQQELRKRGLQ